jgi:uncharacterized NAD-dependent epimerase/dehydratase family protein
MYPNQCECALPMPSQSVATDERWVLTYSQSGTAAPQLPAAFISAMISPQIRYVEDHHASLSARSFQ